VVFGSASSTRRIALSLAVPTADTALLFILDSPVGASEFTNPRVSEAGEPARSSHRAEFVRPLRGQREVSVYFGKKRADVLHGYSPGRQRFRFVRFATTGTERFVHWGKRYIQTKAAAPLSSG
jgi:hypothetical protein